MLEPWDSLGEWIILLLFLAWYLKLCTLVGPFADYYFRSLIYSLESLWLTNEFCCRLYWSLD